MLDIVDSVDMTQVCSCNCLHSLRILCIIVVLLSDGQEELLNAWSECPHVPLWWPGPSTLSCHVASSLTPLLLCVGVGGGGGAEPVQGARRDTCHHTNTATGAHLWTHLGHRQGKLENLTRKR